MLTVLKVCREKNKSNIFKRLFGARAQAFIRTAGDVTYLEIICRQSKKGMPWKKIEDLSLSCDGKILMPKDVFPPKEGKIKRFDSMDYNIHLLLELLTEALTKEKRKTGLSLAICSQDPATIEKVLNKTLYLVPDIRIITLFPEHLYSLQMEILHQTGAAVPISDSVSAARDCNIFFAPDGLPTGLKCKENTLVLAPRGKGGGLTIRWADADIPPELDSAYSEEYDKMEFLAAFYEAGESRLATLLQPTWGKNINGSFSAEELGKYIEKNIKIPTAD